MYVIGGGEYLDGAVDDIFELSGCGMFGCNEKAVNDAVTKR